MLNYLMYCHNHCGIKYFGSNFTFAVYSFCMLCLLNATIHFCCIYHKFCCTNFFVTLKKLLKLQIASSASNALQFTQCQYLTSCHSQIAVLKCLSTQPCVIHLQAVPPAPIIGTPLGKKQSKVSSTPRNCKPNWPKSSCSALSSIHIKMPN